MSKLEDICEELFIVRSSLRGLSGLFHTTRAEVSLNEDELAGIGNLLFIHIVKLEKLEDKLRSRIDFK